MVLQEVSQILDQLNHLLQRPLKISEKIEAPINMVKIIVETIAVF